MARNKNPYGDPVSIYRKGVRYRVRYYPTGLITEAKDRKELSDSFHSRETAEKSADLLRQHLLEHRGIYGPGSNKSYTPLADALATYVGEQKKGIATQAIPAGTAAGRISDVTLALKKISSTREFRVRDLSDERARTVIAHLSEGQGRSGAPVAANTIKKRRVSLKHFGTWLLTNGYVERHPFHFLEAVNVEDQIAMKAERRMRALARVNNVNFSSDGDDDSAIGLEDVPTLFIVSQLSDAIRMVESHGTRLLDLRNRPLSPDAAWQTSQQPMLEVATGLRLCETLALHTSRIDLATLTIGVDRQLEPRRPWRVGVAPPLIPPKHNKSRTANVWPVYAESLERLMHHADSHTNGWLFPPTGRQLWRAKARETEWNRATKLMKLLRAESICGGVPEEELPALWTWRPHYTRHTYGSYSLAPVESGGLGWSVLSVKESMGHQSEKTTTEIYRHVTSEERARVRTTTMNWPGLK